MFLTASRAAVAAPDVAVLQHDGSAYGRFDRGAPNLAPRQAAALHFYATHSDSYDFLIVFPAFDANLIEAGTLGIHWGVRNDVSGTGEPQFDVGPEFGSQSRLKAYVDIASLTPGVSTNQASLPTALDVIAHEIAHQWSGKAAFRDSETGALSTELLGQDAAHWSYFLSSQGSVLFGSEWHDNADGTFTAGAFERRYSDLDLYLMGFLAPQEVGPLTLLRPGASTTAQPTDLPPPAGTTIAASGRTLNIADVIAAEGPRIPAAGDGQQVFRAAFAVLLAPGQQPDPAQLAFVDAVRRAWSNQFFFLTRGRGVMETELVEAPAQAAPGPGASAGLDYLLSRQRADGSWADQPGTVVRETQEALAALSVFGGDPRAAAAAARGAASLAAATLDSVDAASRGVLGLLAAGADASTARTALLGMAQPGADGGSGPTAGYASTVIDSALAARALSAAGVDPSSPSRLSFLLAKQGADGGWPYLAAGPSRIEPTALAMATLLLQPKTDAVALALRQAIAFLQARSDASGGYTDDVPSASATALALLELASSQQLSTDRAAQGIRALTNAQAADGSWSGSVHQTAQALQALQRLALPNLSLAPDSITLPVALATDGEVVQATVLVRNTGFSAAPAATLGIFDSGGLSLGSGLVPMLRPGASVTVAVQLDTRGHAGSSQALAVIDPEGLVAETRKDDNRASAPLSIAGPPDGIDLFVAEGSARVLPRAITRLPGAVQVQATVGNLGRRDALGAQVVLVLGGARAATATVDLLAGTTATVQLAVAIQTARGAVPFQIVVDPDLQIDDVRRGNNHLEGSIPVSPTVDLAVAGLQVSPSPVAQGRDLAISFLIVNRGTSDVADATVTPSVTSGASHLDALQPLLHLFVPAGGSIARTLIWRAGVAGPAVVTVRATTGGDVDSSNDSASASISVLPSSLPNLVIDSISLSPPDAPVGQVVTASLVVRNTGAADAGGFVVDFTLDDGGGAARLLGHLPVTGLAAGGSATVSTNFTPARSSQSTLFAAADPDNRVIEFAEDDNLAVLTFTPAGLPDLLVTSADVRPDTLFPVGGSSLPVHVTVHNGGGQAARSVPVELFLGSPESGGTLIGSLVFAAIGAQGSADAAFSWDTGQASGAQVLTAVIDRAGTLTEQRTDNNRAVRQVLVQDGAVALSNPVFSPNGDGIKDVTEVFFKRIQPGPVTVQISDARGTPIRTLQGDAQAASLIWDGRDDGGTVVWDGSYQIAVSSGGAPIGTATAIVDDDQSAIQDSLGTDLIRDENLLLRLPQYNDLAPSVRDEGNQGQPLSDDSGAVFLTFDNNVTDCALIFVPVAAGDPQRVASGSDLCSAGLLQMGPHSVAYFVNYYTGELHARDLRTGLDTVVVRASDVPEGVSQYQVSPDGRLIALAREIGGAGEVGVELFTLDGGAPPRILIEARRFEPLDFNGFSFAFSPDSSTLAVVDPGGEVLLIPVDGAGVRTLLPRGSNLTCSGDCLGWSADGSTLYAVTSTFSLSPLSEGGIFPVTDTGFLKAVDVASGSQREVYRSATRPPDDKFFSTVTWVGPIFVAPRGDVALVTNVETTIATKDTGLYLLPTAGGQPQLILPGFAEGSWSPRGSFLMAGSHALTTLANHTTLLSASQPAGAPVIVFRGTATDANLEEYSISVQPLAGGASQEVARSTTPVVDGVLGSWAPSVPGVYRATLTSTDQAGNIRSDSAVIGFSRAPVISNVHSDPQFISPNGDGVQDTLLVSYSVSQPVTAHFRIVAASGAVVRAIDRVHASSGDSSFNWDGRDDSGLVVPDGAYAVQIDSLLLPVVVDTVPPQVELHYTEQAFPVRTGSPIGWRFDAFVPDLEEAVSGKSSDSNLDSWMLEESEPGRDRIRRGRDRQHRRSVRARWRARRAGRQGGAAPGARPRRK